MFVEPAQVTRKNYEACLQKISRSPSTNGTQPGYIDTLRSNDMARQRGLRARLDRLEGNAHQTMNTAQGAISGVREAAEGLIEELQDGIDVELVRKPGASVFDFFQGKCDTLPFKLRIVVEE